MKGCYLFTVKEISDYKLIEQTAYQNDSLAMLGKLSASIAHEIRNPLTAIRGFIQLLHPYLHQLGKEEYAKIILPRSIVRTILSMNFCPPLSRQFRRWG